MTQTNQVTPRRHARPAIQSSGTCFISAPVSADLRRLKGVVRDHGLSPVVLAEQPSSAVPTLKSVKRLVQAADLVIGVVAGDASSRNVYFEIGIAYGLGKRVPILTQGHQGAEGLGDLAATFVRTDLSNTEAIGFAIDQLLAARPRREANGAELAEVTRPIGALADELLDRLERTVQSPAPTDLDRLVIAALEGSGVPVISTSSDPGAGADIAVWSDDLGAWVGNPLLIEVKSSLGGVASIDQLAGKLSRSGATYLLLLYLDDPNRVLERVGSLPPGLLFLPVRSLLHQLRDHSFADVIRALRNRQVHGIA